MSAGLARRAEDWPWSSLHVRSRRDHPLHALLSEWPVRRPRDWVDTVNEALTPRELEALQICMARSRPYGGSIWQTGTCARLGLEHTLRPEGRPRKPAACPKN